MKFRFGLNCTRNGYQGFLLGAPESDRTSLASTLIRIPLNPADFRRLKAAGNLEVAVVLTPSMPDGVVVEHETSLKLATRDLPYETHMNVYRIHGKVSEIRYFLPWAKTPFTTQQVN